jgi:hypothetical protein
MIAAPVRFTPRSRWRRSIRRRRDAVAAENVGAVSLRSFGIGSTSPRLINRAKVAALIPAARASSSLERYASARREVSTVGAPGRVRGGVLTLAHPTAVRSAGAVACCFKVSYASRSVAFGRSGTTIRTTA